MSDAAHRLLELAEEIGALQYGDFQLTAGRRSAYYFDGRLVSLHPEGAYLVGKALLPLVRASGAEAVGGPTLGADPMVAAIALTSYQEGYPVTAFIVRKERKEHGTGQLIEGPLRPGAPVAIVDDTCTTGGSLLQSIAAAEEMGCRVVAVLAILDRREGGGEELRRRGYAFHALWVPDAKGTVRVVGETPL